MSPDRIRPALHFTAQQGWTNDPHGIVHVAGQYHLFFQYNPAATQWSEHCHWGHAVSDDLVTWREREVALSPEGGEVGCWSGSTVVDDRGPAILYTRISGPDWGRGEVALARPTRDMSDWRRDPQASVIDGPPPRDPGFVHFRDPQVRRDGDMWRAVLGAGIPGVGGCALQYSSADLEAWTFDGVVAQRAVDERDPVWSGEVWECPQLLAVADRWVLLISVFGDDRGHDVVHAVGDLADNRFTPTHWGTFAHGRPFYATTTFTDAEGLPCAMSWMRERGDAAPEGSPWCSAMSLVHVLSLTDDDRLTVSQHPALDAVLPALRPDPGVGSAGAGAGGAGADLGEVGTTWRVQVDRDAWGSDWRLDVEGGTDPWQVVADAASGTLVVTSADGEQLLRMPLGEQPGVVDIVVDADTCEITSSTAEGIGNCWVPASRSTRLRLERVT